MRDMTFDDVVKELAWRAWLEAWDQARGSETMQNITVRTAQSRFERWWNENYE